jgi:hypothetical protein
MEFIKINIDRLKKLPFDKATEEVRVFLELQEKALVSSEEPSTGYSNFFLRGFFVSHSNAGNSLVDAQAIVDFSKRFGNPYKILGIKLFSLQEVSKAYNRLALQFHPDKNSSKDAEEKMKLLNEAKAILLNDDKRKILDEFLLGTLKSRGEPETKKLKLE